MVIAPTVVIEQQMIGLMSAWGTTFLHLGTVRPENIGDILKKEKPNILIASIERLQEKAVLAALLTIKLCYVSVDEAQVFTQYV